MKVAALFVMRDSIYKTLPNVDAFDKDRDARTFQGGMPIVGHPPCKRWSSLNNLVLARYPHRAKEFAHGNDGGLFKFALTTVRENGGILEHPAFSRAWTTFDLPAPAFNRWQRGVCGGWSIELDQRMFGHPARKRTWLYAYGLPSLPSLPSEPIAESGKVVRVYRKRLADATWVRTPASQQNREISHKLADATPPDFARWLVEAARTACREGAKNG